MKSSWLVPRRGISRASTSSYAAGNVRIFALAYRTLGREEDARDVVQDAFLRAYRGLPRFKGEAKFSSWLYRITLNLCRDWIRRERRAPIVPTPAGADPNAFADEQVSPSVSVEELVGRRQMSDAVARALAELPEDQRTAILMKEYHGLTFQEIADTLAVSAEHGEDAVVSGTLRVASPVGAPAGGAGESSTRDVGKHVVASSFSSKGASHV